MTQQNIISGVAFGANKGASTKLNSSLSGLSVSHNNKSYFKDHLLENDTARKIVTLIENNKGLCVQEFADEYIKANALDPNCRKTQNKIAVLIRQILADTSVGHTLASNLFVALPAIGGRGRWFLNLSLTVQSQIKRRTYADQMGRVGYEMDTSVPVVLGSTFSGFRKDYLAPSGFGRTRWLSQVNLRQITRTDVSLIDFAKVDTVVRRERAEYADRASEAAAGIAAAKTEQDRVVAEFRAMMAEQRVAQAEMIATFASAAQGRTITTEVADEAIEINPTVTPPTDAPRRGRGRPSAN